MRIHPDPGDDDSDHRKSFFCVDEAKFKRYFFQYVERKFRQYPQNSVTQFTMVVASFLSPTHDILEARKGLEITLSCINPFSRYYQSYLLRLIGRVVTYLPVDLFN
jgi:hypothetical protein